MLTHQQDAQRHRRKRPASQTARKPIAAKTQHANTKKGAEPGASPNFAPSLTKHLSASLIVRRLARRSRTSSHAARCANVVRHAREELGFRLVRGTTRAALQHFAEMRHVQPRQERVRGFRCHVRLGIAARGDGNVQNGADAREQISSTATNAAPSAWPSPPA